MVYPLPLKEDVDIKFSPHTSVLALQAVTKGDVTAEACPLPIPTCMALVSSGLSPFTWNMTGSLG